jgi:hypothetical protein
MLPDRHGSSRALIQNLLFQGISLWEFRSSEVNFVIQAEAGWQAKAPAPQSPVSDRVS